MMTGWEQDVVTKRWRPSAPRAEPLGRRGGAGAASRGGGCRPRCWPSTTPAGPAARRCGPSWACSSTAALTEDRSGFLPLADVDRILLAVVDPGALAERGIGALRHRHSPGVQGGYVSNGCPECDALVGRFRVDDLLADHLAVGGALTDLAVDITVDLLGDRVWRGAPRMR